MSGRMMGPAQPSTDRDAALAVLADIHGNTWALEAVIADIAARGVARILNLGDCVYGPLDPAATARRLIAAGWPTVRGNEDRLIAAPPAADESATLQFARRRLAPEAVAWLAALPATLCIDDELLLCHGTPGNDTRYLLHEVGPGGARRRTPEEIAAELATHPQAAGARLILCGHDHLPATRQLDDGRLIVNPGSVGLPAYDDEFPAPHTMEAGTPHARYALLLRRGKTWTVEQRRVTYDWNAAAGEAARNGRPDWATWLRTGRVA